MSVRLVIVLVLACNGQRVQARTAHSQGSIAAQSGNSFKAYDDMQRHATYPSTKVIRRNVLAKLLFAVKPQSVFRPSAVGTLHELHPKKLRRHGQFRNYIVGVETRRRIPPLFMNSETSVGRPAPIDIPLIVSIVFWYIGSYYYNVATKLALNAGATPFPLIVATAQFGIGALYALFLWLAPDSRPKPSITRRDYIATLPVAACSAYAGSALTCAFGVGAVSFIQVVRSTEPAFAALVGSIFYGVSLSLSKWLCLIPVIGGVVMASVSELNFAWPALVLTSISNMLVAVRANENKKLMNTPGISSRMGSVGNLFAVQSINAFLLCIPLMILMEGNSFATFLSLCKTSPVFRRNLVISALWRYLFSELATGVIKKTGAVTQSVLNSLRSALVIIVASHVMGEGMSLFKLFSCGVTIGGVFLYSAIDAILKK